MLDSHRPGLYFLAMEFNQQRAVITGGGRGIGAATARATLERTSPQRRLYQPQEVAYQVVSLCDPRAGGVNGQALVLDGGWVQS